MGSSQFAAGPGSGESLGMNIPCSSSLEGFVSRGMGICVPWNGISYPVEWDFVSHGMEFCVPRNGNFCPME